MKTASFQFSRRAPVVALLLALFAGALGGHAAVPVITSETGVVAVEFGRPFEYQIKASSKPLGYSATGLPFWMKREGALLRGTPVVRTESVIILRALNRDGLSDPKRVVFRVVESSPAIDQASEITSPTSLAGH